MRVLRFLYLNIFAFVLAGVAVGVFLLPLDIFLKALKLLVVFLLAASAVRLFAQLKSKEKKLRILVARNMKEIRFDTFKQLSQTLCGNLMINTALGDLRKTENYISVSDAEWKRIKRKALGEKAEAVRKKNANAVGVSESQSHEIMEKGGMLCE